MLLLNRNDIVALLDLNDCIRSVEQAFRLYAEGKSLRPQLMHVEADHGEFHIKAGGLELESSYFGVKVNAGFFKNPEQYGLPAIQGMIYLADATNGSPLALMDSAEITKMRTGAATAVAAKYLARPDSTVVTIFGCGTQGKIQLQALSRVFDLKQVMAHGRNPERSDAFAAEMSDELGIPVKAVKDPQEAVHMSDIVVTCTPSRQPFLMSEYVPRGTFIAAVGADSPDKNELDPVLVLSGKYVADILDQCAKVGELHHAINQGLMTTDDVHSDLGDIVAGKKPGRTSDTEITIFDSTGTALQDVATAAVVYERATQSNQGTQFNLSE